MLGKPESGNLDEARRALPIFQARGKFLRQMQGFQTAIVIGETGSGKTTQIPQVSVFFTHLFRVIKAECRLGPTVRMVVNDFNLGLFGHN